MEVPSEAVAGLSGSVATSPGAVATECGMCWEPMGERWALIPCGHTQYCRACIDQLGREHVRLKRMCPECRCLIKDKIRIYI